MVHTLVFLQAPPYPTGFFICDACREKGSGPVYHCSACIFDLHPSCIATGEQVSHFSHFKHPLHAEALESCKSHTCDVCGDHAFPTVYHCNDCNFDLHPHCARAPRFVQHPFHRHTLHLLPKSDPYSGSCWCDACGKEASNYVYHCSVCKFDLHIFCAMLPSNPLHPKHPDHRLKLLDRPDKIRRVSCRECRRDQSSGNWMYGCEECGFYLHVACAAIPRHEAASCLSSGASAPSTSASSSDIEAVVKVMDRLLVSASDRVSSGEGRSMRKVMKMLELQQQCAPVSITSAAAASRVSSEGSHRNTCPACLDEYSSDRQRKNLMCGHHFHTGCILRWLDSSNRCPICRQQVLLIDGP